MPADVLRALALSRLTALSKPGGVSEGSRPETRSAAWCRARWRADMRKPSTAPRDPSSSRFRLGRGRIAWRRCCAQRASWTLTLQSSRSTAGAPTTQCPALPSLRSCVRSLQTSSRLCASGTAAPLPTFGGTRKADATKSRRATVVNRGTLAPALYSLAQHDALAMAQSRLEEGAYLAAILDNLYLVTTPARARPALDDVTRTVEQHAGVAANLGKTRVYRAAGGPPPPGVEELGPDVWCGGDSEPATRSLIALSVPIGHADFIQRKLAARLDDECRLLGELRELPDLQSAWLLLLYCASPRAQHVLRTVPPRDAAAYDQAVWTTVQHILAEPDALGQQWDAARQVAFLPAAAGFSNWANHG